MDSLWYILPGITKQSRLHIGGYQNPESRITSFVCQLNSFNLTSIRVDSTR
jgi:hypothetical protein